jgi:RNA polymerase sigma factor (sigma-70 family)
MALDTIASIKKNPKRKTDVAMVNRDNLEKLIVKYQPQLKSFIRRRVANSEDAEDILQDVLIQLVKTVNAAISPVEQVAAWLYRVARNMIINHNLRKHEVSLPVYRDEETGDTVLEDFSDALFGGEALSDSPERVYLRSLVWTELEAALSELPSEQRKIFEMTELDNIPLKEIAEATGISVNTLLSRKHYAVLHLRRRLAELYMDILEQ